MKLTNVILVILVSVVRVQSEGTHSLCTGCQDSEVFTRVKRAKYYANPLRFYRRPPITIPIKGPFSYTPPPGYMMEDDMQPSFLRQKVSKRPMNDGIGDENLSNIAKFLSKKDLDKVIEFANEKERESQKYDKAALYDRFNYINNKAVQYESSYFNNIELDNAKRFSLGGPYFNAQDDLRRDVGYNSANENDFQETNPFLYAGQETGAFSFNENKMQGQQYVHKPYVQDVSGNFKRNSANIYTDSSIMQEELLPRPSNLREDAYEASYTNNVPKVVKADSDAYKVENVGHLPLMNYHSKPDTVDSYKVPHYTVTSDGDFSAPASNTNIPVEPAPPVSTAKGQSDAHLKAVKIWTHRSKGTAYYLHDDGTLSLEKPLRNKNNYSHP